ncbi:alpha/beta hydrolase [Algicella marina]|uniref:Prolyl oligopeptidase family serine peptidase n=1 Tax=Algicella marina TaxID=2683284 RepID=A0A6P1T051_9RHOB|nr:prolyl oligopeptidase family serine peptidase [Algicella marina]QHQ35091.1 prolyl oligopeptidase family serine peptidase [Algicella marina]
MTLTQERKAAASGTARSMMILVHGYGADGRDLIGLAEPLAPHLPDTVFLAPNAPTRCTNNPMGFQWFPIPWLDGSSEVEAGIAMADAAQQFDAYLDAVAAEEGIGPDRTVLVGFSQGTMMSLHVGPRRAAAFAGIVGFSGRLLQPKALASEVRSKPPVLLIHGDMDEVVPFESMAEAESGLIVAGLEVETHVSRGTGHGIAPDGLSLALQATLAWLA